MDKKMTYAGVGEDYDLLDPFKRRAQQAARETASHLARFDFSEVTLSRGESVYLIETPECYLAHAEEGLGTKNLVADTMYRLTEKSYYDNIAQDTVATIVNDVITLGALPLSVAMHLAVSSSEWFHDQKWYSDLINGWKKACDLSRCAWGGGETPALKGVVGPNTVLLSGSAIGIIKPKSHLINYNNIQSGDVIILIESSGIHANGLTLARRIVDKLPQGYFTILNSGRSYGETLLDLAIIYVPLIEECLNAGIEIHYAINITGHGWRKLMRASQSFAYIIENLPEPQEIFKFIQLHGPIEDQEMYATFNMGAGFALYVPEKEVSKIITIAQDVGRKAWRAGYIEQSNQREVIIVPKNLEFRGSSFKIR